ncbi:MAG: kelch repeat-containing protein, partial [Methylomicrobium sp.]
MLSMFVTFVGITAQPATAAVSYTPITLATPDRNGHTATALKEGEVLLIGGKKSDGTVVHKGVEIVNVNTPTAQPVALTDMASARTDHTATPLSDGLVLVAGGNDGATSLSSSAILDTNANTWDSAVPDMATPRAGHTATKLADGKVLVAGGRNGTTTLNSTEIFDPVTKTWEPGPNLATARSKHSAIKLNDGKVLIVGGEDSDNAALTSADLYDPATASIATVSTQLATARVKPDLRLLQDGKVQVIGGANDANAGGSFEMYDPVESHPKAGFNAKAQAVNPTNTQDDVLYAQTRASIFGGSGAPYADILNRNGYMITEIGQFDPVSGDPLPQKTKVLVSGGVNSTNASASKASYVLDGSPATISTNQTDYAPGKDVVVNGSGWEPNEDVMISWQKTKEGTTPENVGPFPWTADGNGKLVNKLIYQPVDLTDIDATFVLMAKGALSGFVAQTSFTDATKQSILALTGPTPNTIASGSTLTWSASVCERGTSNACSTASNIPAGYSFTFREYSDSGCQTVIRNLATLSQSSAASTFNTGSQTFNAPTPASTTTYYYKAIHTSQDLIGDNWNTANSDCNAVTVTVSAANHAPTFTKGANQTVNEDAGAQTVNGWATGIDDGDPSATQILTFNVTGNTNASLFSAGPTVDASGNLTYTLAANANGSATITLALSDNGGTANGGVDTSSPQSFTITVNAVNDAPSFTKGANQTVYENSGAHAVSPWATSISKGPADESGQVLTFNVTGNTNASLFSAGPTVDASGNLSFTSATNVSGSATITLTLSDNGGTANGGVDTSSPQTFTITVDAINHAPTFTKGANQTVNEDAGAQTVNGWATAISAGPANESGQVLTFNVTGNTNASLFSAGPAVDASGNLTYTP